MTCIRFFFDKKSYEMITNKSYQTFETVTSSVKTKVKGYGYVPTNAKDLKLRKSDPDYYRKLFEFNPNFTYRIIDPVFMLNIYF